MWSNIFHFYKTQKPNLWKVFNGWLSSTVQICFNSATFFPPTLLHLSYSTHTLFQLTWKIYNQEARTRNSPNISQNWVPCLFLFPCTLAARSSGAGKSSCAVLKFFSHTSSIPSNRRWCIWNVTTDPGDRLRCKNVHMLIFVMNVAILNAQSFKNEP